ncbi:hypothetical protein BBJ28_00026031, partial [Nothophytophthora sp. Chile5]
KIEQLYNKVRPYVPKEYVNDPMYDPPNDEDERKAKEMKKARVERRKMAKRKKDEDREAASKERSGGKQVAAAETKTAEASAEAMDVDEGSAKRGQDADCSNCDADTEQATGKDASHAKKRPRKQTEAPK